MDSPVSQEELPVLSLGRWEPLRVAWRRRFWDDSWGQQVVLSSAAYLLATRRSESAGHWR